MCNDSVSCSLNTAHCEEKLPYPLFLYQICVGKVSNKLILFTQ